MNDNLSVGKIEKISDGGMRSGKTYTFLKALESEMSKLKDERDRYKATLEEIAKQLHSPCGDIAWAALKDPEPKNVEL